MLVQKLNCLATGFLQGFYDILRATDRIQGLHHMQSFQNVDGLKSPGILFQVFSILVMGSQSCFHKIP